MSPLAISERLSGRAEATLFGLISILFFTSGFSALLYQVIWQRMLALFSGADVYSITIIVAAYMSGLGCGSLAGGYVADRLESAPRILCYGLAELLVGLFALASKWLYYDLLYSQLGAWSLSPAVNGLLLFGSLLIPTFCMGLSLPLLSRAFAGSVEVAPSRIASLYGLNTLGAAVGALATTWSLAARLGFERCLVLGAALNLACALGSLAMLRPAARIGVSGTSSRSNEARASAKAPIAYAWPLVYALSGLIALSLEIVWFRLLGVMLKSTAFTFGTLLAIYLVGLGAGSLLGIPWARRLRRPASAFFALQAGVTLFACGSIALFAGGLEAGLFPSIANYLARYEPLGVGTALRGLYQILSATGTVSDQTRELVRLFVSLYVVLPAALLGLPTLLMGLSFPILQRVVQDDPIVLGRRVGALQAANIAGSTLGAILVGCVSLRLLGTSWTLKLLGALGSIFLFLGYRGGTSCRSRRVLYGTALALMAFATIGVPSGATLWGLLHGTAGGQTEEAEDETGITMIARTTGARWNVFTGGIGQSWLPYGGAHSWLGLLPVMLHPAPRRIAIIGLGSGDTVFSAGGRAATEAIVCVEIVRSQLSTLRALAKEQDFGGLRSILEDPRIEFEQADGRALIRKWNDAYDIIEADALRPNAAYAGNLYSLEYFKMVKTHLRDGGYAVTWAPTGRTLRTLVKVFPYVLVLSVENVAIAIGSTERIPWDPRTVRERLLAPFARDYYAREGIDPEAIASRLDELPPPRVFGPEFDRRAIVDFNSDLNPRDEFLASRPNPD